jgi:hypothetical protein
MLRSGLALLMILLAAPACAASRLGGGFHGGGFHGGGFHGGGFHRGFHRGFHGDDGSAFHRKGDRTLVILGGYGFGYNCGFGFDCGVYDSGYGYGFGNGYGGSSGIGGNSVTGESSGYSGGYVPDPEGADIPPVIFPIPCWVRRAAYDPSGAYVGKVLIDLCHPSDSVTVTGSEARTKAPNTGPGTGEPAPEHRFEP